MKKLGKFIANSVLILGIIIVIFLLIPLIPVVDQWYQLAIVKSASMEPNLPVGSLAIYQLQAEYQSGEIVAYQQGDGEEGRLIIHRIVKKNERNKQITYLTQGDATQYLSPNPIYEGEIKGKLIGSIPQLGFAFEWLKNPQGIAVMILIPLVLFIVSELAKFL